jgi:2-oxoglutarate ferredoxin oxidoreductase subunit delta
MAETNEHLAETNEQKAEVPKQKPKRPGLTIINRERCKGCGFCVAFCPARNLQLSKGFNRKGYHYPEVVDPTLCKGCDLCGTLCPDFAIHGLRKKK